METDFWDNRELEHVPNSFTNDCLQFILSSEVCMNSSREIIFQFSASFCTLVQKIAVLDDLLRNYLASLKEINYKSQTCASIDKFIGIGL